MTDGKLIKEVTKQFLSNRNSELADILPLIQKCKAELLEYGECSECSEPDGTETPIFIIPAKIWIKWFGGFR